LPLIEEREPDLVLVDLRLASGSGLDVVAQIRQKDATASVIMLTGYGSIATALSATKLGADDYISKPADVDQILAAYEKLARDDVSTQNDELSAPSLARVEWEHIQRVLADSGGNISKAARILGIHRRSLQRKLDRYPPNR
jgi:two-component system response regulator RegA